MLSILKRMAKRILPEPLRQTIRKQQIERRFRKIDADWAHHFSKGYPRGINLICSIRGEFGLGQSSRLIANVLNNGEIPFTIYNFEYTRDMNNDHTYDSLITDTLPYGVNLIHVNPLEMEIAAMQLPSAVWKDHYNIAFWLWELEELPRKLAKSIPLFDEIWTPSEFVSRAVRKSSDKPVRTIPYCIQAHADNSFDRDWFRLPKDRFLFLTMFDFNSVTERKNPWAALNAYKQAFASENDSIGLVIKVGSSTEGFLNELKAQIGQRKDVFILTDRFSKVQVNSLLKAVDVLISLHRAEGFGLVLAEAMLLGTPAIATNWSANTEFMDSSVACMVDYQLIELKEDLFPYEKGSRWADADIGQAAVFMRRLFEDKEFYKCISNAAEEHVKEKLGLAQAVSLFDMALEEIYNEENKSEFF